MAPKASSSSRKEDPQIASCNFQAVFDTDNFEDDLKIMIAILKRSYLRNPFTKSTNIIPRSYVIKAYLSGSVDTDDDTVMVVLEDESIGIIDRKMFAAAVGIEEEYEKDDAGKDTNVVLTEYDAYPTDVQLIHFLNQIGYADREPLLRDIKKSKFPRKWSVAVHYIIRCLCGKTGGMDSILKNMVYLLWGLYYQKKIDVVSILWGDFKYYFINKKNDVPNARYLSRCLKTLYSGRPEFSIDESEKKFEPSSLKKFTPISKCPPEIRKLPQHLLDLAAFDEDEILERYLESAESLLDWEPLPDSEDSGSSSSEDGDDDDAADEEEIETHTEPISPVKIYKRKGASTSSPQPAKRARQTPPSQTHFHTALGNSAVFTASLSYTIYHSHTLHCTLVL